MKRIMLFFVLFFILLSGNIFADVERGGVTHATVQAFQTSQLIQTGYTTVWSITFVATSANGNFILYDATSVPSGQGLTKIKAEGQQATQGNMSYQDFANPPLVFGTGLYLAVTNGYVVIEYQ